MHDKNSEIYDSKTDIPTFTIHSWQVGFYERENIKDMISATSTYHQFLDNLKQAFNSTVNLSNYKTIHLYMYYGSVHHLQALIDFKKDYESSALTKIKISLTLSFEAIWFDSNRSKFWGDKFGHFKSILLESQYYFPDIKVFAMTNRFSRYIFKNYDILLPTLCHPILSNTISPQTKNNPISQQFDESHKPEILLIGRHSVGKFPESYFEIIDGILSNSNISVKMRKSVSFKAEINKLKEAHPDNFYTLPDQMTQQDYEIAFKNADIVLIPYSPDNFLMRSSGLLTDAVMHNKPVICFGESSISDIVFQHKIGIYCNVANCQSLLSAIDLIYANYQLYYESVYRYKEYLLESATFNRQLKECCSASVSLIC